MSDKNPEDYSVVRTIFFERDVLVGDLFVGEVALAEDASLSVESYGVQFLASDVVEPKFDGEGDAENFATTVPWSNIRFIYSEAVLKTSKGDD